VTIRGSGFTDVVDVRFGAASAAAFTVVSASEIRATTPAATAGTVDVRVVRTGVSSARRKADRFSYGRPPVLSTLSRTAGLTIGGERVTIHGTRLSGATAVLFGGTPGTNLEVTSSHELRVTAPAHAAGGVDVRVVTRYGTSAAVPSDRYAYATAPAPRVTGLSPASGYTVGGGTVTIGGSDFHGISAVTFGRNAAEVVSRTPTRLVVRVPAHPVGTVDVGVTGAYGTSATSPAARYTYTQTPAPVVTKVSPASGSHRGGTRVTITGSHFYEVAEVTFGDVPGTGLTVASDTRLKVTTPPHAAGAVAVQVVVNTHLASAPSGSARFTYA
jgi:hypothetical protein